MRTLLVALLFALTAAGCSRPKEYEVHRPNTKLPAWVFDAAGDLTDERLPSGTRVEILDDGRRDEHSYVRIKVLEGHLEGRSVRILPSNVREVPR